MNHDDFEERLRATLTTHAARAPESVRVERRVLDGVLVERSPRTLRWRTWGIPLAAAAAVAAVAVTLVGVQHYRPSASHSQPPAQSISAGPTPTVQQTFSTPAASATSVVTPDSQPQPVRTTVISVPGLTNVQVEDLSFVGSQVWAWAWAGCASIPHMECTTMLHSTDGGATWQQFPSPLPPTPTTAGCPTCSFNVRFATPDIGYVYDSAALYMTTDGGRNWHKQQGGAVQLETLSGNVIRVAPSPADCAPPSCAFTVETAPIGTSTWQAVGPRMTTPSGTSRAPQLVRTGDTAVIAVFGVQASGVPSAQAQLYISNDNGATWSSRSDPCQPRGGEFDTAAIAAGVDGSIGTVCVRREQASTTSPEYLAVSTDGGETFSLGTAIDQLSQRIVMPDGASALVDGDGIYRADRATGRWALVLGGVLPAWMGFESATDGRVLAEDGMTLYTTHDAGATWSAIHFR